MYVKNTRVDFRYELSVLLSMAMISSRSGQAKCSYVRTYVALISVPRAGTSNKPEVLNQQFHLN